MLRRVALLVPSLLLACSSAETTPPQSTQDSGTTSDASTDAPATDTGAPSDSGSPSETGTDAAPSTTCGSAPYVNLSGSIQIQNITGLEPAKDVKITSPACPGAFFTTESDGTFGFDVQKGIKSSIFVTATGAIPAVLGESQAEMDTTAVDLVLLPAIFKGFISDWKSGDPAILVKVMPVMGATGTCAAPDGVTISVMGQPGAKVSYFDDKTPPGVIAGATKTSASGLVTITGVTGTAVTVLGTKTGCTATTKFSMLTGVTTLAPDYLSEVVMQLGN